MASCSGSKVKCNLLSHFAAIAATAAAAALKSTHKVPINWVLQVQIEGGKGFEVDYAKRTFIGFIDSISWTTMNIGSYMKMSFALEQQLVDFDHEHWWTNYFGPVLTWNSVLSEFCLILNKLPSENPYLIWPKLGFHNFLWNQNFLGSRNLSPKNSVI